MSLLESVREVCLAEIGARIALGAQQSQWALVLSGESSSEKCAKDLTDQIDDPGTSNAKRITVTSPDDFIVALRGDGESIVVAVGFDDFSTQDWRTLDAERSQLSRNSPSVIVTRTATAGKIATSAPNLWSWIGGSIYRAREDRFLTQEDREQRLIVLRERYGLKDEEVLKHYESSSETQDPEIAEWLVLLGFGDRIQLDSSSDARGELVD